MASLDLKFIKKRKIEMIETSTPPTELDIQPDIDPINDAALKKRLLNRIAVAVVIVAGLLGSLAIFDLLNAPQPPQKLMAESPAAPAAMVVAVDSIEKPPVAAATETESQSSPAPVQGVPEESAAPETAAQKSTVDEKPLTKPAASRLAMLHRAEPAPPVASGLKSPPPASGAGRAPERAAQHPASRPLKRAAESQFGLQLGVFSNLDNAEELRAKLEQNGIPATIEARVHAGPFATRAEADAARAKLKELGISDSLPITMKSRKIP
ncbi:MAG: SPOR domain-containing protein [Burkholderiaceae bacterium]|nr:SPOR domain-containing protein [Sulfuritalea sp.]MCF8176827.1 SPOR domain-containing protein [Burkholderiaceae bacterium]